MPQRRGGSSAARGVSVRQGRAQDFLAAVFDLSLFLRDCARRRPQMLDALFDQTVEERLAAILARNRRKPRAPSQCPKTA